MLNEYKNVVGYSPSDFFYASVLNSSEGIDCGNIDLGNVDTGNTQIYQDVCLNQSLVNSWTDHKINHAGSRQALQDSQSAFNVGVLNTINLVAGIGFIVWAFTDGWIYR
jgi:hypothetical protein